MTYKKNLSSYLSGDIDSKVLTITQLYRTIRYRFKQYHKKDISKTRCLVDIEIYPNGNMKTLKVQFIEGGRHDRSRNYEFEDFDFKLYTKP